MYDLAALEATLAGTVFSGKLHFTLITKSTNTDALEAARAGAPHGSVYFADAQSAGRGRGDHRWQSDAEQGLYVSVLLRFPLAAERLQLLPLAAGLAAAEAIYTVSGLTVDLRWPNDLLLGEHKTGGILVESKLDGATLAYAVVGIGINAHQRDFDAGLATPATSLDRAAGRTISREELLACLLKSLEHETRALGDEDSIRTIPARVAASSSWVRGRSVEVHGPQSCTGVTAGLDANGFLLVETASGIVTVQTGGVRAAKAG
jgi:BirA family biotin operon repressor/biotin-[acetyl-CoA-carboxylase] ligase